MPSARCGRNRGILQGADDFPWRGFGIKDKCLYILDVGFNVMNAPQQSAPHTVLPSMLQTIVEAICDRPRDTAAQRTVRSHAVRETVQGFHPRDPVEIMFAGLAVTHAYLVEDAAHDVFRSQDDRVKAQTRSTIVALGRSMFGFLKELRDAQTGGARPRRPSNSNRNLIACARAGQAARQCDGRGGQTD